MDNLADAVASLELDDNETMPYGSSHWDRMPAELHAMILRAAGPLTLFVNGLLGDKRNLDEATVEALWTDAVSIDWQGDLGLLPDIDFRVGGFEESERPSLDMLSLPVSRSMYSRLCTRFPEQAVCYDIDPRLNQYQVDIDPEFYRNFDATRLHHILMRNGWLDLVDFSHPISLGWIAIYYGHAALLKHLADHHGVDLGKFQSYEGWKAMDLAAENGSLDVVQMLHEAGSASCSQDAMLYAAARGHLDVVKWLHENRTEGCTTDAMDSAAMNGHLKVVRFLVACGYEFTIDALSEAEDGAIVDVLVDSMTLSRATEMLRRARVANVARKLIERLERAVAEKQA